MPDDADLLQRYAETRSESAFTELVERYIDLVHTAALRRLGGDSHRAADVTQHVFIALARHARTLSRRPVLVGWLYTTTRHAVLDHLRAEKRRLIREDSAHEFQAMSEPSAIADEWTALRPLLDLAMDELGESEREAILLRFFEERSFVEIGAKCSITEDTARMRTHRALEKLHGLLQRRGITSTAAALGLTLVGQTVAAAPAGLATLVTGSALAGAAITSTAALTAGALTLMSTTKTLLVVAGILTAAAIGSAIYEARLAKNANLAASNLQRERDALLTQTAALETRLNEASASLARAAEHPAQAAAQRPEAEPKPVAPLSPSAQAWANPAYGRLFVEKARLSFALRYSRLYAHLHFTPAQIVEFENTLAESQQGIVDTFAEAVAHGLSVSDPSVKHLGLEPQQAMLPTLRRLLSAPDFAAWVQYEQDRFSRDFVTSVASNVYFTDTPLNADQGEQLARILKDNHGHGSLSYVDWTAVNTQAHGLLSVPQLAVLKTLSEQQRLETELQKISSQPQK